MRPRRIKMSSLDRGHDHHDVDAPTRARGSDDRSGRRLLTHPLAILAVVAVMAYGVAAVALNLLVDSDQVLGWLVPRASGLLHRPVSAGDARVALLPRPSIHVADVRVDNLEDFDGPALAYVERVRLDVRWLPLLVGRVTVGRVHLDAPRVYLGIDEAGVSNFGDLIPSGADGVPTDAPVALAIGRLTASDASVSYFNAPAARSFAISGGDADVALGPDGAVGWRADLTAESDSMLARMASVTDEIVHLAGPRARLTLLGDGTGRSIRIADGSVELSGETLALRGRVSGLTGSRPSYDLQLTNDSMDAAVLAAVLPASTRSTRMPVTDGRLGVTLQVTRARSPGRPPLVRGSLHLADVGLHVDGQTMLDDVTGAIGVTPDELVLDSLTGLFAGGPFELSGSVARDTRAMVLHTRALPDLDALDRLGLVPASTTLSGDADLDLTVSGRLDAPDSLDVSGLVALEGVQAKHGRIGVPLYVPAGELTLSDGAVSWSELAVLVGQDEVVTTGRLEGLFTREADGDAVPLLDASLRAARLDLGAVLPRRDGTPDVTYARLALAHLGDRQIDGRTASRILPDMGVSRPSRLPVHGTVALELDTLTFRSYRLESVTARIELSDTTLSVDAPSFAAWGGTSSGSLRLAVGDAPAEPFSFALTSDGASAEALLAALTPIEDAIAGTLDLELEVSGTVDAALLPIEEGLAGKASLSITDGRLHDTGPNLVVADFLGSEDWVDLSFASWDTDVDLEERRLEVRRSRLAGDEARVAFHGLVDLDGSHDLSVGLSIPADRLRTVSLRRTGIGQSVLDRLAAARSSLDLGLRMSGPLTAPQLEPDASNAVALAR